MLLDEFGPLVGWKADLETRARRLATFARIQREAASRSDELLALGCFDRPSGMARRARSRRSPSSAAMLSGSTPRRPRVRSGSCRASSRRASDLAAGAGAGLARPRRPASRERRRDERAFVFFDWTDAASRIRSSTSSSCSSRTTAELRRRARTPTSASGRTVATQRELLELWRLAEPLASLESGRQLPLDPRERRARDGDRARADDRSLASPRARSRPAHGATTRRWAR